jgi:hypothetical protein
MPDYNYTPTGSNLQIDPANNQTAFDDTLDVHGAQATIHESADVVGGSLSVGQYFQYSPTQGATYCPQSGSNYPCDLLQLWRLPLTADLSLTAPTAASQAVSMQYTASSNDLSLRVQSLVPSVQGTLDVPGVPSGMHIDGSFSFDTGAELTITAPTAMPYFYLAGANIPLSQSNNVTCKLSGHGLPPGVTMTGHLQTQLSYTALVQMTGDPGLTDVELHPVTNPICASPPSVIGVKTKGTSNSPRFSMGMSLGLGPGFNRVAWDWSSEFLGLPTPVSDWDEFDWNESFANYGDGWISSLVWEPDPNNANAFLSYPAGDLNVGCTSTSAVDGNLTEFAPSQIPFQPTFAQVNNGIVLCANRVAYYQLNPQSVAFEHCSDWGILFACPAGLNGNGTSRYSNGGVFGVTSDWVLPDVIKASYGDNTDPLGLAKR